MTEERCSVCNIFARQAADHLDNLHDAEEKIDQLHRLMKIIEDDRQYAQDEWEKATGKDWFEEHPW